MGMASSRNSHDSYGKRVCRYGSGNWHRAQNDACQSTVKNNSWLFIWMDGVQMFCFFKTEILNYILRKVFYRKCLSVAAKTPIQSQTRESERGARRKREKGGGETRRSLSLIPHHTLNKHCAQYSSASWVPSMASFHICRSATDWYIMHYKSLGWFFIHWVMSQHWDMSVYNISNIQCPLFWCLLARFMKAVTGEMYSHLSSEVSLIINKVLNLL